MPYERIDPGGPDGAAALDQIAIEFARFAVDEGRRILTWDNDRDRRWNDALRRAGCIEHRRKLFVKRDLTTNVPDDQGLGWRTLAEDDEAAFVARMMDVSEGDPFEDDARDADREWQELKDHIGAALDPTLWRTALVDGEPIGVLLPTVFPGDVCEGSISYVGVLPAHRGCGYGRRLHADGLRLMAERGATHYVGSTDVRNEAMARTFAANGCRVTGTQVFWNAG